jgi:Concanavalin A-like lectin/glucanases superfamily/Subtilase family
MSSRLKSGGYLVVVVAIIALLAFWLSKTKRQSHDIAAAKPALNAPGAAVNPGQTSGAGGPRPSSSAGSPAPVVATSPASPPSSAGPAGALTTAADSGLSAGVLKQIAALEAEKAARTPAEQKLDSQLLYADRMRRGVPVADGVPAQRVNLDKDGQGRVLMDIKADVTGELLQHIKTLGGRVLNSFPQYQSIRAAVPLAAVEDLAARAEVRFIQPAVRVLRNTVVSQGDYAHQADTARATFGVNGSGVKIGVVSDSVDYLTNSPVNGLVTVLPGQSGIPASGEGTAMLEIIHDLAPGAQLFFATGDGSASVMASNILQLRFDYGCDIIVDDLAYYDESPFQDDIIAQAVNAATADGALYFSSAGNSGNLDSGTSGTWEGDFVNGGAAGPPVNGRGGFIHSFGAANYDLLTRSSSAGADTVLIWSDPLGASTNDYDLFTLDFSGTTIVSSSVNIQDGSQDPYEHVPSAFTGYRFVVVLASGTNRFLHLDTQRGQLAVATDGSVRGHNAAASGLSVAAVNVANAIYPNPFTGGSSDPVETFSSDGPRRMFYNPSGVPFTPGNFSSTGGVVYQKPDFAAADNVSTAVTGFSLFPGTSAAAPHAAAIAALLKSYRPNLTAAQARTILTGTALDIMAPGADRDSGAGIVMALPALRQAFPDALDVTPATGFTAGGPLGGPFSPAFQSFTLTNIGSGSLNWSLAGKPSWLDVSSGGGTLTPGGPAATVTVSLNTSAASGLPAGIYYANVSFTNLTSGIGQGRAFILVVQAPASLSGYADTVRSFNPVGYWALNETNQPPPPDSAIDQGAIGSAGDGFAIDGVSEGEPGVVGTAFRFFNPGPSPLYVGSRVDIPWQAALNPNGPFTVEFWVKPRQLTSDLYCPACSLDATENGGSSRLGWIFYQWSDNTWQFRVGGLGGYASPAAGGAAQAGVWQHLAGVYDGTNIYLYVNGQKVAGPVAVPMFGPNPRTPLRLGATSLPNRGFDGWVDEVAIYAKALSASDIAAHYAAATTNGAGYTAQIQAAHPVGYWPLDDTAAVPPDANALPVAYNSGGAPELYGLYQPGTVPDVAGVPDNGFGTNNRGCLFNGAAGYVSIPGSTLNITGPLTLSAWVKIDAANGNPQTIVGKGDTSYRLYTDPNGYPHFADGLQSSGDITGGTTVADGQWHHLVGVYDGVGSEQLYVDGLAVASTNGATGPISGNDGDVWIGGAPDHGTLHLFVGKVDEVAIFTNALSSAQVRQLFTSAAPLARLTSVTQTNGVIAFAWSALSGQNYQVQYKTNLAQTDWMNLGAPLTATNATTTASDAIGPEPQRYYRVLLVP